MAKIFPFQPYRFAPKAGPLDSLVTQPYDKITPRMRARYLSLSPYNLVRVILGERFPSDSETDNVYTRAARYLNDWISSGILAQDPEPGLFACFQEFSCPDTGERLLRKGFIGLGAVEDYAEGTVHRHEETLSGPKMDRLELLRHTRAHAGQLFMLYPDPLGEIDRILDTVAQAAPPLEVVDEYQAIHRLWKISDPPPDRPDSAAHGGQAPADRRRPSPLRDRARLSRPESRSGGRAQRDDDLRQHALPRPQDPGHPSRGPQPRPVRRRGLPARRGPALPPYAVGIPGGAAPGLGRTAPGGDPHRCGALRQPVSARRRARARRARRKLPPPGPAPEPAGTR